MGDVTTKKPRCPKCGADAGCSGRDVGATDYYDYYVLGCNHCGYVQAVGHRGGDPSCGSELGECPFCGSTRNSHSSGEDISHVVGNLTEFFEEGVLCEGDSQKQVS